MENNKTRKKFLEEWENSRDYQLRYGMDYIASLYIKKGKNHRNIKYLWNKGEFSNALKKVLIGEFYEKFNSQIDLEKLISKNFEDLPEEIRKFTIKRVETHTKHYEMLGPFI